MSDDTIQPSSIGYGMIWTWFYLSCSGYSLHPLLFVATSLVNISSRDDTFETARWRKFSKTNRRGIAAIARRPEAVCFSVHLSVYLYNDLFFDHQTCFVPQRNSLFKHLNLKNLREALSLQFSLQPRLAPQCSTIVVLRLVRTRRCGYLSTTTQHLTNTDSYRARVSLALSTSLPL